MLYPSWDLWLRLFDHASNTVSETEGRAIADGINNIGANDRAVAGTPPYAPMGDYSHQAPFNTPNQGFAGSNWGAGATRLKTVAVPGFAPPPGRTGPAPGNFNGSDPQYLAELALVEAKGGFQDGTRTGQEEVTGVYWGYDGPPEVGTPPRLYMQVALTVLDSLHKRSPAPLNLDEELLAIAGVGIAMAEAGIDAWFYKYSPDHMLWRPALGIPHAGRAGWLPYGRPDTNGSGVGLTPDFPAYPSGHATFGAAAFHVLRLFLVQQGAAQFNADGTDTMRFTFTSDEYNGRNTCPRSGTPRPAITRTYDSLWAAIVDNSISRVFLGVHWQFDGVTVKGADPDGELGVPASPQDLGRRGGVWLGLQIANQVAGYLGVSSATFSASQS